MKYLISFIIIATSFIYTQEFKEGESFDKIVAVVGKFKILKSEIDGQMARYAQADPNFDFYNKDLRNTILDAIIQEKLIVMKALRDSIEVTQDEKDQQWQMLLEQWKASYGSISRVESVFGKSIGEVKYEYEDEIEQRILAMKLQQMKFGFVSISPSEVESFYEEYKDSLDIQPDKYEIAHIQKFIKANKDQKKEAYKKAMKIRDSLLLGMDFAKLAENNSMDFNTAGGGGDLGWINKGRLFAEFEKAAFALQTGETSLPVETPFGYHIIQTIEKNESSIHTRHILIKFGETTNNKDETIKKLSEIKQQILNGESFDDLALQYSEDDNTRGFGGVIGKFTLSELPPQLRTIIEDMEEGDISEPTPYSLEESKPAFSIVKLVRFIPSHKTSYEKDKEYIETIAKNFKQQKMLKEWVEKLKKEIYWEKYN